MYQIIIKGLASNTQNVIEWDPTATDLSTSLLELLISRKLPIAYNCYGEGVCRKCILKCNHENKLSCQIFLKDLEDNAIIEIPYL